jgi:hypothetical protein
MFETMSGDLWEAALKLHPGGLGDLAGNRHRTKKSSSNEQEYTTQKKQISLDLLRSHSWDTKTKMGTILRTKYNFTSLAGIREAYGAAFNKGFEDIDKIIMNDALDRLSALRNVMVHKAAVIDNEYLKKVKAFPTLPSSTLGGTLTLDGKIVSDLIHEVVLRSTELLSGVDKWISTH